MNRSIQVAVAALLLRTDYEDVTTVSNLALTKRIPLVPVSD